jgi:cbb3-type cytochrome oxidase subunit 3
MSPTSAASRTRARTVSPARTRCAHGGRAFPSVMFRSSSPCAPEVRTPRTPAATAGKKCFILQNRQILYVLKNQKREFDPIIFFIFATMFRNSSTMFATEATIFATFAAPKEKVTASSRSKSNQKTRDIKKKKNRDFRVFFFVFLFFFGFCFSVFRWDRRSTAGRGSAGNIETKEKEEETKKKGQAP